MQDGEYFSSFSLLLSSLELSDTQVYEPLIRALLGTASHVCEVVVLKHPEEVQWWAMPQIQTLESGVQIGSDPRPGSGVQGGFKPWVQTLGSNPGFKS